MYAKLEEMCKVSSKKILNWIIPEGSSPDNVRKSKDLCGYYSDKVDIACSLIITGEGVPSYILRRTCGLCTSCYFTHIIHEVTQNEVNDADRVLIDLFVKATTNTRSVKAVDDSPYI